MKYSVWTIGGLLIPVLILVAFFGRLDLREGNPDAGNYERFAGSMVSGEILELKPLEEVRYYRAVRTPGYPALIVLATGGLKGPVSNMLLLHLALAVFTTVFIALLLSPHCPTLLSGSLVAGIFLLLRDYYPMVMTEWVAVNAIFIMSGMVVVTLRKPSSLNLALIGLLASCAVLIRPALAPMLLVLPCLLLFRRDLSVGRLLLVPATAIPIVLWMLFNLHYIDSFTMAQLRGHNLLGIGSMIGHAESEPDDSPELKLFIEEFNAEKVPTLADEEAFVADWDKNFNRMQFEANIYWIAYPIMRKYQWGVIPFDRNIMGIYGQRVIAENPWRYLSYVLHGLKVYFSYAIGIPYVALLMLLIPLYALYSGTARFACWAALTAFGIYFVHAFIIAAFQAAFYRFIVITLYPFLALATICLISILIENGTLKKITDRLPAWCRPLLETQEQR